MHGVQTQLAGHQGAAVVGQLELVKRHHVVAVAHVADVVVVVHVVVVVDAAPAGAAGGRVAVDEHVRVRVRISCTGHHPLRAVMTIESWNEFVSFLLFVLLFYLW